MKYRTFGASLSVDYQLCTLLTSIIPSDIVHAYTRMLGQLLFNSGICHASEIVVNL